MKKRFIAIIVTIAFLLSFAAPAFAMTHDAVYEWDGTAETFERQVGHFCNTGAEQKVAISGDGYMERSSTATLSKGKITVDETSDFVTAEDATNNLTVTSVIKLCVPPKIEEVVTEFVYGEDVGWQSHTISDGVVDTVDVFDWLHYPGYWSLEEDYDLRDIWFDVINNWAEVGLWYFDYEEQDYVFITPEEYTAEHYASDMARALDADYEQLQEWSRTAVLGEGWPAGSYREYEYDWLTDQIWAVEVEANPGMSGNVHQEFEAAYGDTYAGMVEDKDDLRDDQWGFEEDTDVHAGYSAIRGVDYVGNYFHIDQMARTSDGELRRFIDISEPFEGTYLMEDFEVVGEVEVEEAFTMDNVAPGEEIEVVWYDLF